MKTSPDKIPSRRLAAAHAAWSLTVFALFTLLLLSVTPGLRAESLWSANGQASRSMFADRKAAAKGDILTIVVSESAVAQSSQSKKSTRDS